MAWLSLILIATITDIFLCLMQQSASGRFPIHFVVKSICPENLEIFLKNCERTKVNLKFSAQNSLHLLVNSLTEDNYESVKKCAKLLLFYGCSPNLPDNSLRTPFYQLLYKEASLNTNGEIIDVFLENSEIDFHTYKSQEIVNMMRTLRPNHVITGAAKVITFEFMMGLIDSREELNFEIFFKAFQMNSREKFVDECLKLFEIVVANGMINAVELLLGKNVDVNARPRDARYLKPPAFQASSSGYFNVLALLLKRRELDFSYMRGTEKHTLLHEVCQNFKETSHSSARVDYQKCFDMIATDRRCDVNDLDDIGCSPLHYTVKYKNDQATIALLKRGAYINGLNSFGRTPIDEMAYATLKTFLDESITANETKNDGKSDVVLDYGFLVAPKSLQSLDGFSREISALKRISDSDELRTLITHPVLRSFLFLKWTMLNFIFYLNLALSVVFLAAFVAFFIASQFLKKDNRNGWMFLIIQSIFVVTLVLLLARETIQLCLSYRKYFKNLMNWLEISIIAIAFFVFFTKNIDQDFSQLVLSGLLTLGAFFETLQIIISLPSLAVRKYVNYFCRTLMIILTNVSWFLILFGITSAVFYLTFNDKESDGSWVSEVQRCFLPTIEPAEYSAASTNTTTTMRPSTKHPSSDSLTPVASSCTNIYITMLLVFTTVIWFSLMKALKSCSQSENADDTIINLAQRIEILNSYESMISKSNSSSMKQRIFSWLRVGISLFPFSIANGQIVVRPSHANEILSLEKRNLHNTMLEVVNMRPLITKHQALNAYTKLSTMPASIMEQIKLVLNSRQERKDATENEEKLRNEIVATRNQMNYQMKLNNDLLTEQKKLLEKLLSESETIAEYKHEIFC